MNELEALEAELGLRAERAAFYRSLTHRELELVQHQLELHAEALELQRDALESQRNAIDASIDALNQALATALGDCDYVAAQLAPEAPPEAPRVLAWIVEPPALERAEGCVKGGARFPPRASYQWRGLILVSSEMRLRLCQRASVSATPAQHTGARMKPPVYSAVQFLKQRVLRAR